MDERPRFVARLLEGEKMAPLCVDFGISHKTGYKIFDRYKDFGVHAFSDWSHRAPPAGESRWISADANGKSGMFLFVAVHRFRLASIRQWVR